MNRYDANTPVSWQRFLCALGLAILAIFATATLLSPATDGWQKIAAGCLLAVAIYTVWRMTQLSTPTKTVRRHTANHAPTQIDVAELLHLKRNITRQLKQLKQLDPHLFAKGSSHQSQGKDGHTVQLSLHQLPSGTLGCIAVHQLPGQLLLRTNLTIPRRRKSLVCIIRDEYVVTSQSPNHHIHYRQPGIDIASREELLDLYICLQSLTATNTSSP